MTFLLGVGSMLPAMLSSILLQRLTGWSPREPNLLHLLLGALVVVGLAEESWKFLVVRLYAWRRPEFSEPYDGILYAAAAALGFATIENVLYVLNSGFHVGLLRAILAVPGHAFYGVLMGFFLGEARFAGSGTRSVILTLVGLGAAVLAHGLYDFMIFAMDRHPLLLLMLPLFILLAWVVFFEATRRQSEQSPFKRPRLAALHRISSREEERRKEEERRPGR